MIRITLSKPVHYTETRIKTYTTPSSATLDNQSSAS